MTLKRILKEKGWTVQRLSDTVHVSKRTLDTYMTGQRKLSGAAARVVLDIADVLEVDPRELIKDE